MARTDATSLQCTPVVLELALAFCGFLGKDMTLERL